MKKKLVLSPKTLHAETLRKNIGKFLLSYQKGLFNIIDSWKLSRYEYIPDSGLEILLQERDILLDSLLSVLYIELGNMIKTINISSRRKFNNVGLNVAFSKEEENVFNDILVSQKTYFKKYSDDVFLEISREWQTGLIKGDSVDETKRRITNTIFKPKIKNHADLIARTETARAMSLFNQMRLRQNNIEKAEWSSAKDKRVRKCHLARDGMTYDLQKGCFAPCDSKYLHVGFEPRCRCGMIIVL